MGMSEQTNVSDDALQSVGGIVNLLGKPVLVVVAGLTGNFYLCFGLCLGFGVLSLLVLLFTVKGSKKYGRKR